MASPFVHPAQWAIEDLLRECRWTFYRASGPGGQNRNKVETAAEVLHIPSGVSANATERRTQEENRRVALHRLRCKLAAEVRLAIGDESVTPPSMLEIWRAYCRLGRIDVSEENQAFPSVLSYAMDRIAAEGWDLSGAAAHLETTSSQLMKLLKKYPPALRKLNTERQRLGLHSLT